MRGYAAFFELYADKIDALSVLGVDPEAVALGAKLSEQLRLVGNGLRDTQAVLRAQQGYLRANQGYVDYGYRYSSGAVISQRKALDQNAATFAEVNSREILLKLADEISKVRRSLTTKYNVPF